MNKAIIIGIDSYPGAPLYGCVNDARDVASCLSLEQYDFDSIVLLNSQATRSNILRELSKLAYGPEDQGQGNTLLLYFAGHGQVVGQAGHLVTYDAQDFDPGISLAHLAQVMESASMVYDHVISILDCCHSGSAFTWSNSRPLTPSDVEREVPAVNESRCVLAACRPEETAKEIDQRGVFTDTLTDALLGASVNWDGEVTLMGIYEYVVSAVPEEMQTPVFKGDIAGTVVLGAGFEPRQGRPIERSERSRIMSKAQTLVDQYYYLQLRELADRGVRLDRGARQCALELESVVAWFESTEKELPDVRRDPDWVDLSRRVREFRKNLSEVSVGEVTRLGRITRHIGHGGYGHVWEVLGADGRSYALKIFHGNELDDAVKVQRFTNGYLNMRKLEHPRIVRVHEVMVAPFGFAMDLVPGDNLRRTYIDRDGDAAVAVRMMIDICETVQHAHSKKVRHRDIKPENIVISVGVDGQFEPYLTDFDLAYHETDRTVTTNLGVGGVINYAAPEQLYEPNARSARSETVDVFSLAQLMFFLVTGRDPSAENFAKNQEVLRRKLASWIDDRASEALMELYKKATSKAPEDRPQTVVDFVAPLRAAEAIIQIASGTEDVEEDDLCRRIGQLYAGMGRYDSTGGQVRMNSASGQVEVIARLKGSSNKLTATVEVEFSVMGSIPVASLKSGRSARDSINARLDRALQKRYGNAVKRHPGNTGAYQVFVTIPGVRFSVEGITQVCDVITTTVAGIEGS
ncbi:caspase family protein [Streptomyces sp. NPDC057682]|uniref:protein kinase domain-containing protein n=1 Tax=Streptomyces sp. NPDC057682 TaxID=3346210 RepID=UPI0036921945